MLPLSLVTILTIDTEIELDGHLDEAVWQEAAPVNEFQRFRPTQGPAPAGTTEVRFLQDERTLYVGIRVTESRDPIRARISARERINADDQVGIYLDTFHDGRSAYIFYLNPLGIQQDLRHANGDWNPAWNAAFRSNGHATENGYEIEIAFPFRTFKYPSGQDTQDWGLIITRKIPSEGAKYGFPTLENKHPRIMSQAATLSGVKPSKRGSGLELIPALTASQEWPREEDPVFGGLDTAREILRPSVDARIGVTPDIGVTAAVNPDFSQVESDVSDIRINPRFAFKFKEARPFFTDGSDFYEDRSRTLYSRSINEPLYGLKVSGREGPVSIGALNALDKSPLATFHERGTSGFDAEDIENKVAENTVLRLRTDAFKTGFIGFTLGDKRVLGTAESPGATGISEIGGLDADIPLGGRWVVGGSTQQAWNTPGDGGWTHGQQNEVSLVRASGVGTGLELEASDADDDFRNELGFVNQSGLSVFHQEIDQSLTPGGAVEIYTPALYSDQIIERTGDRYFELGNSHKIQVWDVHTFEVEGALTRRNESDLRVDGWLAGASWKGQFGPSIQLNPGINTERSLDFVNLSPAQTLTLSLESTLRPTVGIRLDTLADAQWLAPDGPQDSRNSHLIRNRLTWQFSRQVGLRIIEEYSDGTDLNRTLRSSALLTWLDVPGTAAYIGFTETSDLEEAQPVDRSVFAKISVLIRP
jgi:hypothetical protein